MIDGQVAIGFQLNKLAKWEPGCSDSSVHSVVIRNFLESVVVDDPTNYVDRIVVESVDLCLCISRQIDEFLQLECLRHLL